MNLSATLLLRVLTAGAIFAAWWPMASRPRPSPVPAILITVVLIGLLAWHGRRRRAGALRVIRSQPFPTFLQQKLRRAHPQLDEAAARRVERGLRQFFAASAQAQGQFVAMPSKVVDTLWHEFILHTRGYEVFCAKAFGRLLHHTPAEALSAASRKGSRAHGAMQQRAGLRRAWYWACRDEGIDPRKPSRLPLLFALDASLGIAGGYVYALDCSLLGDDRGRTHCASDLGAGCGSGDGSGCGGDGGSSSSDTSDTSASSSGDGGGDGDGGGGCGGGGD